MTKQTVNTMTVVNSGDMGHSASALYNVREYYFQGDVLKVVFKQKRKRKWKVATIRHGFLLQGDHEKKIRASLPSCWIVKTSETSGFTSRQSLYTMFDDRYYGLFNTWFYEHWREYADHMVAIVGKPGKHHTLDHYEAIQQKAEERAEQEAEAAAEQERINPSPKPPAESSRSIYGTDMAKMARKILAREFPNTHFYVRSDRFDVRVYWQDGPTEQQVGEWIGNWGGKGFDGMIDCSYHYNMWLMPNGKASLAWHPGTSGSSAVSNPKPSDNAEYVYFGQDIQLNRVYSEAFMVSCLDKLEEERKAQGYDRPELSRNGWQYLDMKKFSQPCMDVNFQDMEYWERDFFKKAYEFTAPGTIIKADQGANEGQAAQDPVSGGSWSATHDREWTWITGSLDEEQKEAIKGLGFRFSAKRSKRNGVDSFYARERVEMAEITAVLGSNDPAPAEETGEAEQADQWDQDLADLTEQLKGVKQVIRGKLQQYKAEQDETDQAEEQSEPAPASKPKKDPILFHDSYTGDRWSYGLTYRPIGIGAVPDGWIVGSLRDHPDFRHGVIDYARQLTEQEIASFELTAVNEAPAEETDEAASEATTADPAVAMLTGDLDPEETDELKEGFTTITYCPHGEPAPAEGDRDNWIMTTDDYQDWVEEVKSAVDDLEAEQAEAVAKQGPLQDIKIDSDGSGVVVMREWYSDLDRNDITNWVRNFGHVIDTEEWITLGEFAKLIKLYYSVNDAEVSHATIVLASFHEQNEGEHEIGQLSPGYEVWITLTEPAELDGKQKTAVTFVRKLNERGIYTGKIEQCIASGLLSPADGLNYCARFADSFNGAKLQYLSKLNLLVEKVS